MSRPSRSFSLRSPLVLALRRAQVCKTGTQLNSLPKPSPDEVALTSAKLPRTKGKGKRPADVAGLAPPPGRVPQHANPAYNAAAMSIGAMQNMQNGDRRGPPWPVPYYGGDHFRGSPYTPDQGAGGHTTPANASLPLPHPPGGDSNPAHPYPSIEGDAVDRRSSHGSHLPTFGATTPLRPGPSPIAFGGFNVPSWPPMNMQDSGSSSGAPTMPYVNPRFFNQAMGGMPPPPFPMLPFSPLLQFQGSQPMCTMAGPPDTQVPKTQRKRSATPSVKIPVPTKEYMQQASQMPKRRSHPRPLLIILDLNGTLIFRKHKKLPPSFVRRAGLDHFLEELTQKYAVMIWSSSRPATVDGVCKQLFPENKKKSVVAMWGRDKFDLTSAQYNSKLQVYKELHKVWADPEIQASYPGNKPTKSSAAPRSPGGKHSRRNNKRRQGSPMDAFPVGQRWDQTNTILIDDSKLKALSEPYNILEIPEFTNKSAVDESTLFAKVLHKLDILSHHDDVSKLLRLVNGLAEKVGQPILEIEFPLSEGGSFFEEDEEEDGGAKLVPPVTRFRGKGEAAPTAQIQTPIDTDDDPGEIARQKKEAKKARKKAKKEAKKAAKAAQQPTAGEAASADQQVKSTLNGQTSKTTPPNATAPAPVPGANANGTVKLTRGQRRHLAREAKKRAKLLEQQSAAPEPAETETGPRYNFRTREPGNTVTTTEETVESGAVPKTIDLTTNSEPPAHNASAASQSEIDPHRRPRSPSSASSSPSHNSLLDRLEDGLGIHKLR